MAQETLRANRADMEKIKLRQRVLVDVSERSTGTTILGEKVSLPIALSTIGMGGLMHGNGEILACRAAQEAGIPYTLSTMSICSIEDVAGCGRQAVLVPALCHEGPWLRALADRARHRRQMQRAGADRRPAGARPAPRRRQERPRGAAVAEDREPSQHGDQAALDLQRSYRQELDLRQPRRPREGHGGRHGRSPNGHSTSSTKPSTGTTSSGSAASGRAS